MTDAYNARTTRAVVCGCAVGECLAGDFVADAMQRRAKTDIALINNGAMLPGDGLFSDGQMRTGGELTTFDIARALPGITMVAMIKRITGSTLVKVLQTSMGSLQTTCIVQGERSSNFLQVSSTLRVKWSYVEDNVRVSQLWIRLPLDAYMRELRTSCVPKDVIHDDINCGEQNAACGWYLISADLCYSLATSEDLLMPGTAFAHLEELDYRLFGSLVNVVKQHIMLDHNATLSVANIHTVGNRIDQQRDVKKIQIGSMCRTDYRSFAIGNRTTLDKEDAALKQYLHAQRQWAIVCAHVMVTPTHILTGQFDFI